MSSENVDIMGSRCFQICATDLLFSLTVCVYQIKMAWYFSTLRLRQNYCGFANNIFKCIFLNVNVLTSLKIPLKFVPKVPINNIPALIQIMAWCWPGNKPLSEQMMVSPLTYICVTRPQWDKMAWFFFDTMKSLLWLFQLELKVNYFLLDPK